MGEAQHDLKTVLEAVEKGITVTGTARVLGVTRQTIENYRHRWATLDHLILSKRRELVEYAEMGLRGAVLRGEPWAIAFALKTLGKDDGYTERHEVTGKAGGEVTIRVVYGDDGRNSQTTQAAPETAGVSPEQGQA
jgi:hypothetical protein